MSDSERAEILAAVREYILAAIREYSVYSEARGSAPFGATEREQAALTLLGPPFDGTYPIPPGPRTAGRKESPPPNSGGEV